MANALFSFTPFDFTGILSDYSPLEPDYEKQEAGMKEKHDPNLFSMEELGQVYPLCSSEYNAYQQHQQQSSSSKSNCSTLDEYFGSFFPGPAQPMQDVKKFEIIAKPGKEFPQPLALYSSLELLNNYGSGIKKLNLNQNQNHNQFSNASKETHAGSRKRLSTEEIMRVAGATYIQFSDQKYDDFYMLMHPFGYALSALSEEETRDVELAHLLLAAAEKVHYRQFDRASRLLKHCECVAPDRANPVQRVVYYFAEALRERIDKETGRFTSKERESTCDSYGLNINLAALCFHQNVPLNQITQLTSIQAIMENIGAARKLHVIDLQIRSGVQWTAMMQALAERGHRPVEHLKVTAVGLASKHRKIEETGRSLQSFAKSINFPFTFQVIYVSSMNDIKEELFETAGADESLVFVSNMMLRTLISSPDCLENLLRVIKNLNPSLMVVAEVEANHNSPIFANRFIEALFFYSAYFDCLETCMEQNTEHKSVMETMFSRGIREMVALEDNERHTRSVKIDVWRAFFSRFRMVEIGFSESSLCQASLVPKQFPYGNSFSLDKNGECLVVGWKGTPLHSLSAWKFSRERQGRFFANYRF